MRLRSVRTMDPVRTAVRVASVGNVDLAAPPPLPAIDGVTLVTGDRVLLKEQTDATQNGVYEAGVGVARDGSPTDGVLLGQALGQIMFVAEGAVNAGQAFVVASLVPPRFDPVVHRRTLLDDYLDRSPASPGSVQPVLSLTLPAGRLGRNGEKIVARWAGTFAGGTSTRQLVVDFASVTVADTQGLAPGAGSWWIETTVIRTSATTTRVTTLIGIGTATIYTSSPQYTAVTVTGVGGLLNAVPLTLSAGVTGGAATDLVCRLATIEWVAAAPS